MRATINYDYLRPLKAKNLKERHESKFEKKDELSVWSGKNATILPLRSDPKGTMLFGKGGVVDENGEYVDISAIDGRVQGKYDVLNPLYKDEKVVYCGYLVNHWGHFLVEAMSRLWYFLEDDKTVDKYVFFMEDGSEREIKGNYKEALVLLNIWDKLEIINKPTKYKEVVVPELGYKWKTYYSEKQKNVFETIFKNVKPNSSWKKYEKIYFTRKQLSKAGNLEFGGEVLDDFFEKNGYEVISPEKMTLSEMIFCIRNAEVCATLSGSLPHNLLFAQDGKKLIIVERCVLNNEIQVDVNRMKNLNVTYIDANYPIYTVNMSGPFIMAYNDKLQKFAKDNHMLPPDSKFLTSKHLNLCFKKYMENYRKEYNYRWYMDDWYVSYADYLWEAYKDGYKQFQDFLSGERPFKINHYFSWRYMKRFIRRALKRFL